jgi:hypothetical protein
MPEPALTLEANEESLAVGHVAPDAPHLLVIDDDNLHRMIICRVAAKAGYAPAGAATYEEAAVLAQETAFDRRLRDAAPPLGYRLQGAHDRHQRLRRRHVRRDLEGRQVAVLRYWFDRLKSERQTAAAAA